MNGKSASDLVINAIKEKLISGEWKPGMKIAGEIKIAQDLGVSRASVREAMEQMVAMGLFTRRRGDGTYVNDVSSAAMFHQLVPDLMLNGYSEVEILDFREMLEPECVRRFVQGRTAGRIEKLREMCCVMEECAGDGTPKFAEADLKFHLMLVQGCGNPIIIKIMDIIIDVLTYYQYSANELIGPKTGAEEHKRILEAIEAGDGELAALLMKRHIQRSKQDIVDRLKDGRASVGRNGQTAGRESQDLPV